MRQIYLDEAGTSANDTHAVVAGPVVDADRTLIPLHQHLASIKDEFIPEEDKKNFGVFHMTDLWNNGKYFKDKKKWPIEKRRPIIEALADIPKKFELPIVFQFAERQKFTEEHTDLSVGEIDLAITAIAFSACEMTVEKMMREVYSNEIAQIIAEDNQHTRSLIRKAHNSYRDQNLNGNEFGTDFIPFKHIHNGILFSAKDESPALQIADMCAFFIRAHLRNQRFAEKYYQRLNPWMYMLPKGDTAYSPPVCPLYRFGPLVTVYGETDYR